MTLLVITPIMYWAINLLICSIQYNALEVLFWARESKKSNAYIRCRTTLNIVFVILN